MGNLLQGKFGYSFLDAAPIWPRIKRALPVSGQLALGVLAIMTFIGIPLGMLAARFHNTLLDYSIVSTSLFFWSIPPYVLVPVMLIITVLWLDIMNVPRGWKGPLHPSFFVAAAIISTRSLAGVIRQTRGGILEVLQNDYVRTARAKGLTEVKIMARHVARNALISRSYFAGLLVDDFMWGAVFLELAFNLPGLGRLFQQGLAGRDFNIDQRCGAFHCRHDNGTESHRRPDLSSPGSPRCLRLRPLRPSSSRRGKYVRSTGSKRLTGTATEEVGMAQTESANAAELSLEMETDEPRLAACGASLSAYGAQQAVYGGIIHLFASLCNSILWALSGSLPLYAPKPGPNRRRP